MVVYATQTCAEDTELYKALLQNELATYFFSEAAFNLVDAIEQRIHQQQSKEELKQAGYYARSLLSLVVENQRILKRKFDLAKFGLNYYQNSVNI